MNIEEIVKAAVALPATERALLADLLCESLDPGEFGHVEELWAIEASRRRDDIRSKRIQPIPGDEALARVRRSVGR